MTTQEFSNSIDTLLNSYNNQAMFGDTTSKADLSLDEYEKSIFLTQAQDIIIKQYFEQGPIKGQGFDESERRQVDFSNLITINTPSKLASQTSLYDSRGIIYQLPTNILFMLNEKFTITTNNIINNYVVIPINYKEFDRLMSKAYSQPLKKQCWRLFQNVSGVDVLSEIIPISGSVSSNSTTVYKIRYVKKPNPIILTDLPDNLSIDGVSVTTECSLNPIVHIDILNKAVELILSTRGKISPQNKQ